jgi:hypothetical protein
MHEQCTSNARTMHEQMDERQISDPKQVQDSGRPAEG